MSTPDVIADALKLPAGARFVRCALQVNPHHYSGTFRGDGHEGTAAGYATAIVSKARDLDVSVLAVTDHNSVSSLAAFRAAAEGTSVAILPGFELESTEGIHVLCI